MTKSIRLASALALVLLWAASALAGGEPLPTDPALLRGTLDNGFTYLIKKHGTPERRVSLWLHVASGSLNETEATRGIAHYLEHMAFNGSANFPPGSLIPYFQSLGLSFGRDQNAFTSFDQTTYTLGLPDAEPETIDRGLLYLSDVASRLSLLPAEIDSERQIILEEKRARAGARQRVRDAIYERLAPESTFGRRLPIGVEGTIKSVTARDFRDYYARWYVPGNMTLIVVGDIGPAVVTDLIRKHFAAAPKAPRPADRPVGVRPQTTTRAIVATDPELTQASVSIVRVEPPRSPTTTVEQHRRDLVEQIGTWVLNRRLHAQLAQGAVTFLRAHASIRQEARAIRLVSLEASGKPGDWRRMLGDLGVILQRARLHGMSDREVEDARAALISQGQQAKEREATLPARAILRQINGAVARREPVMSAAQRLELLRRLLPGITAAEVSRAFAAGFDPTHVTFIAELPSGSDAPGKADLIALGRSAVNVTPSPGVEVARATALLEKLPSGGKIVEQAEDSASGVLSVWMDNGVRLHHRFMRERRHEASVVITLAGGQIQETADNRGITEAGAQAWNRPAAGALSSTQIRDLMTGKAVRVTGRTDRDSLTLTVSGTPGDLEVGLQLAYLLLTDPVIEPAAFEQWKETEIQRIAARKSEPRGVLIETVAASLYPPDEARIKPFEVSQVQRIRLDAAQAWLKRIVAEAPIEVAVVGDLPRPAALALVERYIGALPPRARISDKAFGALRTIKRPVGPIRVERTIDVKTPQAFVLEGFFGADLQNVRDVRLLALGARVLSTRMNRIIREQKQLVYSIGAASQPAGEYPGFGLFIARAPTAPARTRELATVLEEMYLAFAKDGPTGEEMAVARKQIANHLDQLKEDPEFWSNWLATLDYRGLSLRDLTAAPAAYQRYTAEEVREAFARYSRPDARFRFVIAPGGGRIP